MKVGSFESCGLAVLLTASSFDRNAQGIAYGTFWREMMKKGRKSVVKWRLRLMWGVGTHVGGGAGCAGHIGRIGGVWDSYGGLDEPQFGKQDGNFWFPDRFCGNVWGGFGVWAFSRNRL